MPTPWFAINGIDLAPIVALGSPPKGPRRDIGERSDASDGSLIITRQTRKRDFSCETVPLSSDEAFAWESLLSGEGHVWSFDVSYYSSKGVAGDGSVPAPDVEIQATTKKFGAKALKVGAGETWQSSNTGLEIGLPYTIAAWRKVGTGAWGHVVTRSDGVWWLDGVINDPAFDVLPTVAGATDYQVQLGCGNAGNTTTYWDDVVFSPCLWPLDWAAQVAAAGRAFGPLPYLTATGKNVKEATSRRMAGEVSESATIIANLGAGMAYDVKRLTIELKAV